MRIGPRSQVHADVTAPAAPASSRRPRAGNTHAAAPRTDLPSARPRPGVEATSAPAPRASASKLTQLGQGVRQAGTSVYQGAAQAGGGMRHAGEAAYKGAKKAMKWIDKKLQGSPRGSGRDKPTQTDEERYYGVSMPSTTPTRPSPAAASRPAPQPSSAWRYSERPMTPAERKAHEAEADYHGLAPSYPKVQVAQRVDRPAAPRARPEVSRASIEARQAAERDAHQDAIDNGYL